MASDEAELQQHQKLEKLYISTRAAKVILHVTRAQSHFIDSASVIY